MVDAIYAAKAVFKIEVEHMGGHSFVAATMPAGPWFYEYFAVPDGEFVNIPEYQRTIGLDGVGDLSTEGAAAFSGISDTLRSPDA